MQLLLQIFPMIHIKSFWKKLIQIKRTERIRIREIRIMIIPVHIMESVIKIIQWMIIWISNSQALPSYPISEDLITSLHSLRGLHLVFLLPHLSSMISLQVHFMLNSLIPTLHQSQLHQIHCFLRVHSTDKRIIQFILIIPMAFQIIILLLVPQCTILNTIVNNQVPLFLKDNQKTTNCHLYQAMALWIDYLYHQSLVEIVFIRSSRMPPHLWVWRLYYSSMLLVNTNNSYGSNHSYSAFYNIKETDIHNCMIVLLLFFLWFVDDTTVDRPPIPHPSGTYSPSSFTDEPVRVPTLPFNNQSCMITLLLFIFRWSNDE